jgi:hypothetical protein
VHVALLEAGAEPDTAILDEVHLDAGVLPPVEGQEAGEQGLHRLRRRTHAQHAGVSALERARSLPQRLRVGQQSAGAPQEILALGGELHPAPDTVEEADVQRGFERANLP